jgi:hypothetical protein
VPETTNWICLVWRPTADGPSQEETRIDGGHTHVKGRRGVCVETASLLLCCCVQGAIGRVARALSCRIVLLHRGNLRIHCAVLRLPSYCSILRCRQPDK